MLGPKSLIHHAANAGPEARLAVLLRVQFHDELFVGDFGHRANMLYTYYRDVGAGFAQGSPYAGGAGIILNDDFGYSYPANPFLTGVAYSDVITPTARAAGFSGCLRNPKGQSSPHSDIRGRVRVRVREITARQTAEHLLVAVPGFAVSALRARAGGVARVHPRSLSDRHFQPCP